MKHYLFPIAALALGACGSSGSVDLVAAQEIGVLVAEGVDPETEVETRSGFGNVSAPNVGTASYVYGTTGGELIAAAGFDRSGSLSAPLSSNATFSGTVRLGDVRESGSSLVGDNITLNADFAASTLTGSSAVITVDGTFSGNELGGAVMYDGIEGELDGVISVDGAVGAFAGSNDERGYAGVFQVQ